MENRYYVYVYLDQRKSGQWIYKDKILNYEPFYAGKGTRKRDIEHLCPYMLNRKSRKSSKIKSIIHQTGELPIHQRIYENISQQEATNIEIDFIKTFGRLDLGNGILCNHTDGGDGSHNLPLESRQRINKNRKKKVYQYSLDGKFIKKWNSLSDIEIEKGLNVCNIPTSIKRQGTSDGFIWSYKYLGKSISAKIKWQMPTKYKIVIQLDKNDGRVIMEHESALKAERALNLKKGARNKICDCINGKLKTAYGFKWKKSYEG
jgi:hypothetical protein